MELNESFPDDEKLPSGLQQLSLEEQGPALECEDPSPNTLKPLAESHGIPIKDPPALPWDTEMP